MGRAKGRVPDYLVSPPALALGRGRGFFFPHPQAMRAIVEALQDKPPNRHSSGGSSFDRIKPTEQESANHMPSPTSTSSVECGPSPSVKSQIP